MAPQSSLYRTKTTYFLEHSPMIDSVTHRAPVKITQPPIQKSSNSWAGNFAINKS